MAVLRNRYPLNIPPAGADPLLKYTNQNENFTLIPKMIIFLGKLPYDIGRA
jgi:hypothetical protein